MLFLGLFISKNVRIASLKQFQRLAITFFILFFIVFMDNLREIILELSQYPAFSGALGLVVQN